MMTKYYSDRMKDIGCDVVFKNSLKLDTKAIIKFANENYVSTFSNWLGMVFGLVSFGLYLII